MITSFNWPSCAVHENGNTWNEWNKWNTWNTCHASVCWIEKVRHLIFAFEDQDVGDPTKRDAQVDDLSLGDVVGDVADMDDARRFGRTSRLQFHLLQQMSNSFIELMITEHNHKDAHRETRAGEMNHESSDSIIIEWWSMIDYNYLTRTGSFNSKGIAFKCQVSSAAFHSAHRHIYLLIHNIPRLEIGTA